MKKCTPPRDTERLGETIDRLTEENQRHVLGVLEALAFAQSTQKKEAHSQLGEVDTHKNEGV
jgi:hypothetical protein